MPLRALRGAALVAVAGLGAAAPATAAPGLSILYTRDAAAEAIHDGASGLAGLRAALRQAPAADDVRWPTARRVGKVSGRAFDGLLPAQMVRLLRSGMAQEGGLVAVDEVTAQAFDADGAPALASALEALGPDARRVVLYVSPGVMAQVGRADPRAALPRSLDPLLGALRRAGSVMLLAYGGEGAPLDRQALGTFLTRWADRWGEDRSALHLVLGPDRGVGQDEVWARARATPAGRAILANGASAWGLQTAGEGLAWLRARREFLAAPDAAPPGGDVQVPVGGGLALTAPAGRTVWVTFARPGRVVLRLVPPGAVRGRVVAKLPGPVVGARVRLPADVRPGPYRVVAVARGDGLRDAVSAEMQVRRPPGGSAGLRIAPAGRGVRLWLAPRTRAVVRLVPRGERRGRVIAKVSGPATAVRVGLPPDVRPGRYRVVVVALREGARATASTPVSVRRSPS